jgi:PAS domain S-box-containing protein
MENTPIEILLIEDDLAEAGMIMEMLAGFRKPEFSVQHVQYLAEGLSQLGNKDFDVILVDLGLPDSKGLETALAVRDQAKSTPIVVITVLDDEEVALKALQLDIQDYLIKGEINGNILKRSIRYAIQRKRDIVALRFNEARFRALHDDNPAMIFTLDAEGTILSTNPACTDQMGYTASELEGQPVLKIFHEDDRPAVAEQLQICLQNPDQVHHWQFRKIRKNGGLLWVEELARTVSDPNGALNVLVVCQDITERKRTEEALQKSEKKFAKVFHDVPALLAISTLKEGRYVDVNDTTLRALGYRRAEMIGRTALELNVWADLSDRARVWQALEEKGSVKNIEVRFRGKSGQTLIGLLSAEYIDFNGDRYMLSLTKDITLKKQAQEQIERLNTQLEARAAELEEANRELEAFSYSVAHDLRKPLTTINGYCEVIRELCGDKLDEQCKAYLQEAYDGTWRMNRLIDTLLNFSRVTRIELRREAVDLTAMAQAVAAELKHAEPSRRATFRIAEGVSVTGDAGLLHVVLENLFGNAWKFTGMREEAVIEFGMTEIDGQPACFVRDNGPGFAKEDADKLFIPFQRLAGTEEYRGFGIGLATVERIIRRHGGRIWAEGEPGKGATFWFTLP